MPSAWMTETAIAVLDMTAPQAEELIAGFATSADRYAAGRYASPKGMRRSLGARTLLRALLQRHVASYAPHWEIAGAPGERPELIAAAPKLPFISLAHSRDFVAAGFSYAGSIGIDIEKIDPSRPVGDLARAAFGPAEVACVDREGAVAFYRLWTLREALAKATGQGFGLLANGHDLGLAAAEPGVGRHRCLDREWDTGYWDLAEGYGVAAVLPSRGVSPSLSTPMRLYD